MRYLIYSFITISILYLTGHIFFNLLNIRIDKKYVSVFAKLLLGLILLILSYSIIKTRFQTINIGLFLVFIFLWQTYKFKKPEINYNIKEWANSLKKESEVLLSIIPLLLGLFLFYYFIIFQTTSSIPVVINWDNWALSNFAMFLNFSGKETIKCNYLEFNELGPAPYHYFELWFVALVTNIFKSNYYFTLQMVCIPVLQTIIVVGIWGIMENYKINMLCKLLAVFGLMISAFYFEDIKKIPFYIYAYGFQPNAFDEPWVLKFTLPYIIIIASILFFLYKKYLQGLTILLLLPIFSITLAPGILTSIFIFIIFTYFNKYKLLNKSIKPKYLVFPIIIGLFIMLFYKFFGREHHLIQLPTIEQIFSSLPQLLTKTRVIICVEKIIYAFTLYSPYLIMLGVYLFLSKKKLMNFLSASGGELNPFIIITIIVIISSFILWQIFFFVFASMEFFYYTCVPFINIILCLFLYLTYFKSPNKSYKLILMIFVLLTIIFSLNRSIQIYRVEKNRFENTFSNAYLSQVNEVIQGCNRIGAKIESHNELLVSIFLHPFVNYCGTYINGMLKGEFSLISLSFADIPKEKISESWQENFIKQAPFYRFVEKQKKNNEFISISQSKLDFVKKYNIDFIIVSPEGSIDSIFNPFIERIIFDSKSREKFVLLKKGSTAKCVKICQVVR